REPTVSISGPSLPRILQECRGRTVPPQRRKQDVDVEVGGAPTAGLRGGKRDRHPRLQPDRRTSSKAASSFRTPFSSELLAAPREANRSASQRRRSIDFATQRPRNRPIHPERVWRVEDRVPPVSV